MKTDYVSRSPLSYNDLSIINHHRTACVRPAYSESDVFNSLCLFSLHKYRRYTDRERQNVVRVSLHCLPQRSRVRVKGILHLASITHSVVFISHSFSIGYLFQHKTSTQFPCSTLKPDSNTLHLLNPPHLSRSFPFRPRSH